MSILAQGRQWWRRLQLQRYGVKLGSRLVVGPGVSCQHVSTHGHATVEIGDGSEIGAGVVLHPYGGEIRLGRNVFVGPYAVIYGHGGVTIGDHTLLSMHCRVLSSNHTIPSRNVIIRSQPDVVAATHIGRDVWLGAGVTVLAGVTIGDGCVVGAGAVVTRDLAPYSIAMGVPARVTGVRE